jgi:hypothetical protein
MQVVVVFMAIKIIGPWVMTSSLAGGYQHFREKYCCHLRGDEGSVLYKVS